MNLKERLGLDLNPLSKLRQKPGDIQAMPRLPQTPVDMGFNNLNMYSNTIAGPLVAPKRDFSMMYPFR